MKVVLLVLLLLTLIFAILNGNRRRVHARAQQAPSLPIATHLTGRSAPKHFDWREQGLTFDVPDQGPCGACWALAAVIPLQARFQLGGANVPQLSAQHLLNCQAYCANMNPNSCDDGCNGGMVHHSWLFLRDKGTVPAAVVPFGRTDVRCDASLPGPLYRAANAYALPQSVQAIKEEIQSRGPVSAAMETYDCLVAHHGSGVYERDQSSGWVGGHAVVLIGWDDDDDAWYALNVWGRQWGDNGFFKIRMGTNECGIEELVVAGQPFFSH